MSEPKTYSARAVFDGMKGHHQYAVQAMQEQPTALSGERELDHCPDNAGINLCRFVHRALSAGTLRIERAEWTNSMSHK